MKKLYLTQATLTSNDKIWDKITQQNYFESRKEKLVRLVWANSDSEATELLIEVIKDDYPNTKIDIIDVSVAIGWPE